MSISVLNDKSQAGIFELLQAEVAFTCITDPNPIIATDALFSNIAIFGLEPLQKIAFGSQFHDAEHIQKCFDRIVEKLKDILGGNTATFAVFIFGGEIGKSEAMVDCARKEIAKSSIKMKIAFEAVLKKEADAPLSIAMDTRTNIVTNYVEPKNPQRRTDYLEHMKNFVHPMTGTAGGQGPVLPPDVKIAYCPFETSGRDADEISLVMKNKLYHEKLRHKKDKDDIKSYSHFPAKKTEISRDFNDPNVCCIS